jgi:ActR/RegA family two-component response regulator
MTGDKMNKPDCALLIVEDDADLLQLLAARFRRCGFTVIAASHPNDALKAAESCDFRVALIDRSLPELNGIQLMELLQSRLADLRSIILSGYADPAFEDEALAAGAFAYLRKPCPLSGIERVLEQALEGQAAVRN